MKVSIHRWRNACVFALLTSCLFHCSKSAPVAQSTVSESQAQADVQYRLTKTQQVRAQFASIQEKIRPFGSVLRDLGKAVDVKVDRHPGSVLAGLMDRLSQVLQSAVSGMVETHADGTWVIEHPAPLSLSSGQPGACLHSHVRISGGKVPSGEQIVVAMSGCADPSAFETLATVVVGLDGSRLVTISSATFQNIQNPTVGFDPCTLSVGAAGDSELSCTPMTLVSGQESVELDRLELRSDSSGTHAAIHARLGDAEQGELGTIDLTIEPDAEPALRVCTRSAPCGG
jgi:hypothetical protein